MRLTVDIKNLERTLKKLERVPDNVMNRATKEFRELTPVRSGNARRNTRRDGDTIEADYEYASVLDKGRHMTPKGARGSLQAPRGMTQPLMERLPEIVEEEIKKVD